MVRSTIAMLAGVAALAMATGVVSAQTARGMTDRQAIYVSPSGAHDVLTPNAAGHAMIMKEGRELPAGAIVYRNGGKLYVLEDRKMSGGAMLFSSMQGWFDQATGYIR
ncbi:hypothetical protein [Rhodoplanes roseus]|uniref:Uncharacterized protein n=1 Tax=Rhodoplanes roseus TaxID=29409 RepID=A0A327KV67_9BRAD|nr:hypothetical protein [Rhodoplanes roseus]RAI42790.1 hypothetical protein CH341_17670 [Rhodoplanes roseus]